MSSVEDRLAEPFYLRMMGLNALKNADALWDDLVAAGREASLQDVHELLAPDHWRPVVMGAWFSLGFQRDQVGTSLENAFDLCHGTLTAPGLAIATATIIDRDAVPTLNRYIDRDLEFHYGSTGFVAAVVKQLDGPAVVRPTDDDRRDAAQMFQLARRLRSSLRDGRA